MTQSASLLALADQCVKCGLCLPQCPTYNLSLNENESPRGRISLIQAVSAGQITPSASLLTHLDHCLLCRRCERVCPSQVQYGKLTLQARNELTQLKPALSISAQLGLWFIETPQRLNLFRMLLRFYQHSGLQWLLRKTRALTLFRLQQLEARLPVIHKAFKPTLSDNGSKQRIALFTGCTQNLFDSKAISASYHLLTQLGYEVAIPADQVCCGALHDSQGQAIKAQQLLDNNNAVFNAGKFEKILYLSSGCGAYLTEQKDQHDSFDHFQEITDFLLQHKAFKQLKFKPCTTSVAVHLPCSQKNVLKQNNTALSLLEHIPGIKLFDLEQSACCGAGGTTMLSHPEMAAELRQPLLTSITTNECDVVVTTNPGCQLHLQDGFNQEHPAIRVEHPVTLLAQQLEA